MYLISVQPLSQAPLQSVIYYGDLIWDTCKTWLGLGNVEELSLDIGSCLKKGLNVELEMALLAIQRCLTLLHDDLDPDTN